MLAAEITKGRLPSMTYLVALGFDLAALGFAPLRPLSLERLSMTLRMNCG